MIYYGEIQCESQSTHPRHVVYITDYARLLGLENYHPPAGFPQIDGSTKAIGRDAIKRIQEIRNMERANQISTEDADARIRAIHREPQFMHACAAVLCRNPALRVAFHRPLPDPHSDMSCDYPQVVFVTCRLYHYDASDGFSSSLGVRCTEVDSILGLHVGDLIGVEIVDYSWEGWKDCGNDICGNDSKPVWEWHDALTLKDDSCVSDMNYFYISYDVDEFNALLQDGQIYSGQGFPLPYAFNNKSDQYRRLMEETRVFYSKVHFDPDDPDLNIMQRTNKMIQEALEKRAKRRAKND